MNKVFNTTCDSVREMLSKIETYLEKNRGSLTRDEIIELEDCLTILRKMEEDHCGEESIDYIQMGLKVIEILLRFFLNNDLPM